MKPLFPLFLFGLAATAADEPRPALERPRAFSGTFDDAKLEGWQAEGEAFRWVRAGERERARGVEGAGYAASTPAGKGALVSPPMLVERRYINFLIHGTRDDPSVVGAELRRGDEVVNAAAGTDERAITQELAWRTWEVSRLAGETVTIRFNDRSETGWIGVDSVAQSDTPMAIPTQLGPTPAESTFQPQFHYTPKTGWMNDANGLFYYAGTWHLFHQYRAPGAAQMSWAHATSTDLLHWAHQPIAIPPTGDASAFSGSAAIDWSNASGLQTTEHPPVLLCYTLHPPLKTGRRADQRLVLSRDGGRTFEPYPWNPILQTVDFNDRDPRLFYHAPSRAWEMILSLTRNNTQRDLATYGLFRSWDLHNWELVQRIGPGAWYWECPDFFEMPIAGDPDRKTKWLLGKGSGDYIVGEFDGQKFTPETEPIRTSWGAAFYGAQTFVDAPGGRRVQIGWMNSGPKESTPFAYPAMSFNQQMSFPRELTLRRTREGLRLFREPVREIAQLHARTVQYAARPLRQAARGQPTENPLAEFANARQLDVELIIALQGTRRVWLTLGGEEMFYDAAESRLTALGRTVPWPVHDGRLKLRALLDRTSLELFGNDGELTHAGVFFRGPAEVVNALSVEGGPALLERLVVREVKSIWQ